MYGLIFHNLQTFLIEKFGEEVYDNIRKEAGLEEHIFCVHKQYPEAWIRNIVSSAAQITGWDTDDVLRGMGQRFPRFCGENGYHKILKTVGRNLKEFLNGLDHMHESLRYSYPGMRTPSFYCDEETESGLRLHYRSKRKGFVSYVRGQIEDVAIYLFKIKVTVEIESVEELNEGVHAILRILFKNKVERRKASTGMGTLCPMISTEIILHMFPFHMLFRKDLVMFGIGESLIKVLPDLSGKILTDYFRLTRPAIALTWDNIIEHPNCVFELITNTPTARHNPISKETDSNVNPVHVHLKGQMMYVEHWQAFIYLSSPVLEDLDQMYNIGLYLNDLSIHDASRDLVLVGNQKSAELKLALDQELQKSAMLEESMKKLDIEMQKTDKLLYNMIPKTVANRLRKGDLAVNTCEHFDNVTVLFSDVVGFTTICSKITPMEVVDMLNSLYTSFDTLSEDKKVYKVETIGDAYMVVSGVPERILNHAERVADMAFAMLESVTGKKDPANPQDHIKIRIGIHSGSVVAGVVGTKMPRYCLFGDTVNTASRMETNSVAMSIHISETTKNQLQGGEYIMRKRGSIQIKGKGMMNSYWLIGKGEATNAISTLSLRSIDNSRVAEIITNEEEKIIENSNLLDVCKSQQPHKAVIGDNNETTSHSSGQLSGKDQGNNDQVSVLAKKTPETQSRGSPSEYLHLNGSERYLYSDGKINPKLKKGMHDKEVNRSSLCVLL